MNKTFLKKQQQKLEKDKERLEKELGSFAKKDSKIKGNWKARFPFFGIRTADPAEQTDQIEEHETNLAIEHTLELELAKVNKALGRTKKGKYGICQKCKKTISTKRLEVYPEAENCIKCA